VFQEVNETETNLLFNEIISMDHNQHSDQIQNSDQNSIPSISTFELPSPAFTSSTVDKKIEKQSWVWQWARKEKDDTGNIRVYCTVPRCTNRKGWAMVSSSTSNIRRHLINDHKLNENGTGLGNLQVRSIEEAFNNQGKRTSAHFSKELLEQQVCKVLVRHKLPFLIVESPHMQELLEIARLAPTMDDLKLPSKDTISRRVTQLNC